MMKVLDGDDDETRKKSHSQDICPQFNKHCLPLSFFSPFQLDFSVGLLVRYFFLQKNV